MIDNQEAKKLTSAIQKYEHIIIAKHIAPDWDAQGSALGLKHLILDNFQNKQVYVVGRKFNQTKNFEDEKKLTPEIIKSALLITVDVANFERIDFSEKDSVKEIFKVDHHLKVDHFGAQELVDVSAIACTQVVAQWAIQNDLKISKSAASNLYYGLITDSGRFLYNKTNQETFTIAGKLVATGIDISEIYNDLYLKDLEVERWLHHAFNLAVFEKGYPIAYIKIRHEDSKKYKLTEEEVKMAISVLAGIKQIEIWFIAYESFETDKIKVSIRSRKYEINKVAVKYNGGGHALASGAKLNSFAELENIITDFKKLIDNKL